ncbi:MAG: ferritin-like domain-containing protein [Mycobacteriales bacterium]
MEHELDDERFRALIEESQDLNSDAMKAANEPLNGIVEVGLERRAQRGYADTVREERYERAQAQRLLVMAGVAVGAAGLGALAASPAYAQGAAEDVAALQTAASLENLAVLTYKTALTLPYLMKEDRAIKTVAAFAKITMEQHTEHGKAFNARAVELGGKEQTGTHPELTPVVMAAVPKLKAGGPLDVVALAITLEDTATSTYVANIMSAMTSPEVRLLFGTVAGVESQHLSTLLAVQALLKGGAPELITVKETGGATDAAKLPGAAPSIAIPETFKKIDLARKPAEGAVK